jgi:hypothetical protein
MWRFLANNLCTGIHDRLSRVSMPGSRWDSMTVAGLRRRLAEPQWMMCLVAGLKEVHGSGLFKLFYFYRHDGILNYLC